MNAISCQWIFLNSHPFINSTNGQLTFILNSNRVSDVHKYCVFMNLYPRFILEVFLELSHYSHGVLLCPAFNKKYARRCIKKPLYTPVWKGITFAFYVLYRMLHAFVPCCTCSRCIVVYKLDVTSFQQSLHQIRAAIESGLPSLQQFSELVTFRWGRTSVLQKLDIDMSG